MDILPQFNLVAGLGSWIESFNGCHNNSLLVGLIVNDPFAGKLILENGQNQDDDKNDKRESCAVTIFVILPHLVENKNAGIGSRIARSPLSHNVDMVEGFKGANNRNNQQEKMWSVTTTEM